MSSNGTSSRSCQVKGCDAGKSHLTYGHFTRAGNVMKFNQLRCWRKKKTARVSEALASLFISFIYLELFIHGGFSTNYCCFSKGRVIFTIKSTAH